ncbi:MAG TPA: urease accessory protein UreD [Steroidobacteraceae bacterium]|jgi:urease accessory protein|nr:urease accessory protein UreD [Steroidobacteraceae bacterium]
MSALPSEHGWRARLALAYDVAGARTRLARREHVGPLLVQRAFYPECLSTLGDAGPCHTYIIHPPGGVVSGDELTLEVEVGPAAHALLTTPAAGKFYRRRERRVASLTQSLSVRDGTLEWLPQENIYYPDSVASVHTVVRLAGRARFLGWELNCYGLPANGLDLGDGEIRQRFELWHDDRPVLLERTSIDRSALAARWGLAGRVAAGTLMIYPATGAHLERARTLVDAMTVDAATDPTIDIACTRVDNALCCRGIAARVDRLKQAFSDLWCALRPAVIGREASPPRIWLT